MTDLGDRMLAAINLTVIAALIAVACGLAGCTQQQVEMGQQEVVMAQKVLDAACTNSIVQQAVAAAVPEVGLACAGERMAGPVVAKVLSDPALVAKIVAVSQRIKF